MTTHCIPAEHRETITLLFNGGDQLLPKLTINGVSLLHAAVGIAGEAGEIEEALLPIRLLGAYGDSGGDSIWNGYRQYPGVDVKNMQEELGDHLFYEGALRIAADLEVLPLRTGGNVPDLWCYSDPLQRAQYTSRKQVLCELASLHSTLAGNILDTVKKSVFYCQELNRPKLADLLSQDCWVVGAMVCVLGFSEDEIREHNNMKLRKGPNARYKNGYSDEAAQLRADKEVDHD